MEKIFSALADPSRRKIIEHLHVENSTLLELSENFSISFQAVSKHIKILENADLVRKIKRGKYRELSLNRQPLIKATAWISFHANFWNDSFNNLEELINQQQYDESGSE